jgi:hypothetical protein
MYTRSCVFSQVSPKDTINVKLTFIEGDILGFAGDSKSHPSPFGHVD